MGLPCARESEHICPSRNGDEKAIRELAKAVAVARKLKVPYKVLMVLTGYGRTRLDQLRKYGLSN